MIYKLLEETVCVYDIQESLQWMGNSDILYFCMHICIRTSFPYSTILPRINQQGNSTPWMQSKLRLRHVFATLIFPMIPVKYPLPNRVDFAQFQGFVCLIGWIIEHFSLAKPNRDG